jgi:hypothetical protein
MATLNEEHKRFIVFEFAAFRTGGQVVESLKTEYGVNASLHQVLYYHPEKTTGRKSKLARKWKEFFAEARSQYVAGVASVGISHARYRQELRQLLLDREIANGLRNKGLVIEILETGAKEAGGAYTNRRELTGKGGGPVETVGLTLEDWKKQAAVALSQVDETMSAFADGKNG